MPLGPAFFWGFFFFFPCILFDFILGIAKGRKGRGSGFYRWGERWLLSCMEIHASEIFLVIVGDYRDFCSQHCQQG